MGSSQYQLLEDVGHVTDSIHTNSELDESHSDYKPQLSNPGGDEPGRILK
jgi:hypothetical protein